jgi:CheY-like chemotaxis protein
MSAEVRERAFEPFFTTKGQKGTGLGLAEVYGIVKRHRGRAEIESMPSVGTTIRLVFPRAEQAVGDVTELTEQQRPTRRRRVLLVEDHLDSREFMQQVLMSAGHTVDAAAGVEEAKAFLEKPEQPYDVMLTDIGLADGSGWDLIAFVRERWPNMRAGVATGWEPRSQPGLEGDFILRKPVPTAELLAAIAAEVDR